MAKPDFPVAITNTIRESFVNCHQKAYWAHFRQRVPAFPSIHLHAGASFAKGLEVARRSFYELGLSQDASEQAGRDALIDAYGTFDSDHGMEDSNKSLSNMIRAFEDYFMEYALGVDSIKPHMTPEGKAALEFSFAIPTNVKNPQTGDPILYSGKFDMLGVQQDTLWVVDEKTTSQLGQQWANQWDLNSQFTGYCMAAREYGYPVAGAIIRGIGLLKTKISHVQVPVYRSQWQIDRWWAQLHRDIQMMVALYEADDGSGTEFDFALGAACSSYGNCPYKKLCMSPTPEQWLAVDYVKSDYNPLSGTREES